jgi:hypothetical protein
MCLAKSALAFGLMALYFMHQWNMVFEILHKYKFFKFSTEQWLFSDYQHNVCASFFFSLIPHLTNLT